MSSDTGRTLKGEIEMKGFDKRVVMLNIIAIVQLSAEILLSAFGRHKVAMLVGVAVFIVLAIWWIRVDRGYETGLVVLAVLMYCAASIPGLALQWLPVSWAVIIGTVAGMIGIVPQVFSWL